MWQFVPDQLRGESDSKKFVSRYNQLLIPFCKLVINCSQFLRKCSFFLFIFQMRYINIWMLHLGKNFSCKRFGLKRHDGDLLTWWIKKKHTWNIDLFLANVFKSPKKQTNWVSKVDAFRLVDIVEFIALLQWNNLDNNRFFNASQRDIYL